MRTMRTMQVIQRRWNEVKSGRHMSGAKRRKFFLSCPPLFLALQVQSVVLVNASVWSVQFDHFLVFCSSYSQCPRVQSFVKVWARAPVPWMESASLSCYSFTPKSIIKQPLYLNAYCHKDYFPTVCVQSYAQSDTVNSVL